MLPAPAHPMRLAVTAVLLLGILFTAGCAEEPAPPVPVVDVTGEFGRRPQIAFATPMEIREPHSEVIIEGDGKTLDEGDPVLLAYVALSAVTGDVVEDSYAREPRSLVLGPDAGPLYEELLGQEEGTRLLHLSQGTVTRPEPVVIVYDVLHTEAWGTESSPPADDDSLPTVTTDEDRRPHVEVPDVDPPAQLRVLTLIKGNGPQIQEGGSVTAHYTTVDWATGEEFDSTWGERLAPPAIPFTGLIPAWQDGLLGATVGSRIMIIAPPEAAFGSGTVVFVIDLLATTSPEGNSS